MFEIFLLFFSLFILVVNFLQINVNWVGFTFSTVFLSLLISTQVYSNLGWSLPVAAGVLIFTVLNVYLYWFVLAVGVDFAGLVGQSEILTVSGELLSSPLTVKLVLVAVGVIFCSGISADYGYEYFLLLTNLMIGCFFLVGTTNLVLLYLNFELQGLTLYSLVTYYRFEETNTESGLKYLLLGSVMSCFFLVGLLFEYFKTGSTEIGGSVNFLILFYFLYKIGAAPLHFWTPTIYQSLDYPTLAVVSSLPKVAAWYAILNFETSLILYFSGLISVVVGAIGGLYQLNTASVIAYSGILNNGYLLVMFDRENYWILVYLLTYQVWSALLIVALSVTRWRNVGFFYPYWVYYLLLSVAGLPVVPGLTVKLGLLQSSIEYNYFEIWLIVLTGLIGVVYYLRLLGNFIYRSSTFDSGENLNYLYWFLSVMVTLCVGYTLF